MSLADFYNEMVSSEGDTEEEIVKIAMDEAVSELLDEAEAETQTDVDEDTVKLAAEYDAAGRIMARAFFSEMMKSAQENEEEKKEEKEGEKEEEKEEEKGKEKKKGKSLPPALAAAIQEKKAAIKRAMLEDPEFAQQVLAHYQEND